MSSPDKCIESFDSLSGTPDSCAVSGTSRTGAGLPMRYFVSLFIAFLLAVSLSAHAGMRLTLVMVTPEQYSQLKNDEGALENVLNGSKPGVTLEMGKEWHGIHYLLTEDPWSAKGTLGQVILGGTEFGPDLGYGPARYLTRQQVVAIAAALKHLSVEQFKSRYDPKAMMNAEIYPMIWEREGPEGLKWLVAGLRQLSEFYSRAAGQGKGVILVIM